MKYTNEELCLIFLDSFLGLEYKHKIELFKLINGKTQIKSVIEQEKERIIELVGEKEYSTILNSANAEYFKYIVDGLEKKGIIAVTIKSTAYPKFLSQTEIPPIVLYAKGDISLLNNKDNFAMVGSRKNLPLSISIAENFASAIIQAGMTPVTGIAEGVDVAVLKTALDKNAKAISVIAGGLDNVYPKSHVEIVEKIAKNGLVVSEYPPETVPMRFHFPVRNRIISALSKGVLIVSGGIKSGTMYTAEYAEEYGKDLFAVPYSPGVVSGAGCNELIKKGAILADSPEDILSFYGVEKKEEIKFDFNQREKEIIRALTNGELHVEKLASELGKRVFEIAPDLSMLEIKGVLVKSGNVYGLTRNDLEA
jgi:DNA processing protein